MLTIEHGSVRIAFDDNDPALWRYRLEHEEVELAVAGPEIELDGRPLRLTLQEVEVVAERELPTIDAHEFQVAGQAMDDPSLRLLVTLRIPDHNPIVRFRTTLRSSASHTLTKVTGADHLCYLTLPVGAYHSFTEVRLAEFHVLPHAYLPSEIELAPADFENELEFTGPILAGSNNSHSFVLACEHGSQIPDRYITFEATKKKGIRVRAVKGNYVHGQVIDAEHEYSTPWFDLGGCAGGIEDVARTFRAFVLNHVAEHGRSREPYVFYNTWNYQERNHHWRGKRYLDSMTGERMLAEIDVAHRMGIDVFVIDTGWFAETGDWRVNPDRFPDRLERVRRTLDGHGMQLGLWFDPHAGVECARLKEYRHCVASLGGKEAGPHPVWESGDSYAMCMVSEFGDAFAEELIRLGRELGVTYFKWDGFGQYSCDSPDHWHGTAANSPEERLDSYSFQAPLQMARMAAKICAACPEAIVDFDVTEGQRAFGLAFLAAGKYYILNNGPYYPSFDDPALEAKGMGMGPNVLAFPGMARAANARRTLRFDRWIPSVLTMTHYLSDDPAYSQWINIASLILGHNGIWGDLPAISEEGVERFATALGHYKRVRADVTAAYPLVSGRIGGSPEVHEKIDPLTGRGAVVVFYSYRDVWAFHHDPNGWDKAGRYFGGAFKYVTRATPQEVLWHSPGVEVTFDGQGHAVVEADFSVPGAGIVLFGRE